MPDEHAASAVTIMLSIEDELGDIPEEQRASIAKEITEFRERSAKRDLERTRQIADLESRRLEIERASRLEARQDRARGQHDDAIVLIRGPKRRSHNIIEEQMTESEIANRRAEQATIDANRLYQEEERDWEARETARITLLTKELATLDEERKQKEADRSYHLERFLAFDDDKEAHRMAEDFLRDRSAWTKARAVSRHRELDLDAQDEARDDTLLFSTTTRASQEQNPPSITSAKADSVTKDETVSRKLALTLRTEDTKKSVPLRTDTLLEDEDEDNSRQRRVLDPLQYTDTGTGSSNEDGTAREIELRAIVARVPTSKIELSAFVVKWDQLKPGVTNKLRDFVGKKIFEAIGIEEEDLISAVMAILERRGSASEVEQEIEAAIGDSEESGLITVKIWRYLVILTETAAI